MPARAASYQNLRLTRLAPHAKINSMEPSIIVTAGVAGAAAAVSGVAVWGAVAARSQLFGPTVRRTSDAATLALTFDDGPNPAATPQLLDILDRHAVRATFFLIGQRVGAFPQLAAEIAARGHAIANHTETHPKLALLNSARITDELSRCAEAIHSATGRESRWMRPPFGFRGPNLNGIVRRLNLSGVVMWSRWARDWKPQPAERVIERLRRVQGGDIVLLHDGDFRVLEGDRRHTVAAVEYWLPRWKDAGLRFVTLDDAKF